MVGWLFGCVAGSAWQAWWLYHIDRTDKFIQMNLNFIYIVLFFMMTNPKWMDAEQF